MAAESKKDRLKPIKVEIACLKLVMVTLLITL